MKKFLYVLLLLFGCSPNSSVTRLPIIALDGNKVNYFGKELTLGMNANLYTEGFKKVPYDGPLPLIPIDLYEYENSDGWFSTTNGLVSQVVCKLTSGVEVKIQIGEFTFSSTTNKNDILKKIWLFSKTSG